MKRYLMAALALALVVMWGCLSDDSSDPDVKITSTTLSPFTPRAYKAGDTFESDVIATIDVPVIGSVRYDGTLVTDITDPGAPVNGVTCLLATNTLDATTTNPLVVGLPEENYHSVIQVWFFEDASGLSVVKIDTDGTVDDFGTGVLDVPYPIGGTAAWVGADGNTYTLDGAYTVEVDSYTFDCFKVNRNTSEATKYLTSDLGALVMAYGSSVITSGSLDLAILSYTLTP